MKKNLHIRIVAAMLFLTGIIAGSGCDALIYEDMLNCPQGVYLKFYTKTPCDADTLYPADISNITVYVFDAGDKFYMEWPAENVNLSKSYELLIPFASPGKYSFVAWANNNSNGSFEQKNLKKGITTKGDLLLHLKQTSGYAAGLKNQKLYEGNSNYVFLPDPESIGGPYYDHTSINMWEYTNRIEVIVEGFRNPEDFMVDIKIRNGHYSVNGEVILNSDVMNYPAEYTYIDSTLTAKFNTLKLETGHDDRLTIKGVGEAGEVLYNEDLLGTLLLQNPNVNLRCDHDFIIRFKVKEHIDTYVVTEVWVNDWLIHSYQTGVDADG
ncbi:MULTISPECIES: FimB/Mfa2 family fimbrial subunit [Proteiniphilum]|jgi:hypothetical protein|uniref:FimB/Mfa2 family fimbrial subunit n=1 Tax=Proteiniphilum TaxID=294702 RepID=UPI001EEC82D9|nr:MULTISPECIES: FimB/Mfa2 family fimbrial subunit [Proteiniphilum]ULB33668.1 FimB/Mfa2 family fimbrial subunit [Proteiniphilum propionicum]